MGAEVTLSSYAARLEETASVAGGSNGHVRRPRPSPPPRVRSTLTTAQFDPLLPFEAWRELGIKIGRYANGSAWWLGDWLLFGQHKYGPRYRDAIDFTGLDYQTLRNYASVARHFEPARRRHDLSFQHHAEVCGLDREGQDRWLAHAVANGWSRSELRRRLRGSIQADHARSPQARRLDLTGQRAERWRRAAETSEVSLELWVERTLDEAADTILG